MCEAVLLEALDTLFFRDGKPFSIGEESWAEGMFPPLPSVLYGALRTAYFATHLSDFHKAGDPDNDPTLSLQINHVYLKSQVNSFFPMPLDCLKEERKHKTYYHLLEPQLANGIVSGTRTPFMLTVPGGNGHERAKMESAEGMLLDRMQILSYLDHETVVRACNLNDYVCTEPKVGIGRDPSTATASDTGKLYRVNMRRPATMTSSLFLAVEFTGLDLEEPRLLKIGGEGKSVSCSRHHSITIPSPQSRDEDPQFFKLYLATPAIFDHGWYPNLENIEILTGAVGRPVPVGGFAMRSKDKDGRFKPFPKPLRYAAPAGSVYYCRGNMRDAIEKYHGRSVSDQRAYEGFGIAYIGKLTMNN